MKNIVFFIQDFLQVGGSERVTSLIANELGNLKLHKNLKRLLEAFSQIEQKENSVLI